MRRSLHLVLMLGFLAACVREEPAQIHPFVSSDGSAVEGHYITYGVWVPNWRRNAAYCEDGRSLYSYVTHSICDGTVNEKYFSLRTGELVRVWHDQAIPRMSDRHLKRLLRWRNRFDRPFSMFVLGPDHSREAKYKYSIRLAYGHVLEPDPLRETFKTAFPDTDYHAWAVRNLSEYAAREWSYFVAELFAWYTAPWYEKGSLPVELEEQLEQMAALNWSADWENKSKLHRGEYPDLKAAPWLPDMRTSLARAREAQPCNCYYDNPFMAHDELTFLYIWRWEHRYDMPWVTYDPNAVPLCKYPRGHPWHLTTRCDED